MKRIERIKSYPSICSDSSITEQRLGSARPHIAGAVLLDVLNDSGVHGLLKPVIGIALEGVRVAGVL
jgi:hypothetical protein